MQNEDIIKMTKRELKRLHFIHKAIQKGITQKEAADACNLCERQIRRIIVRIKATSDAGIVHQSRGKPSHARLPEKLKARVINLYKTKYPDFGPTLAQEKLLENHNITISDETLRRWLYEASFVHYRTRKRKPHREWRERKPCLGQMIQMDGSHHDWLEGRGPRLVLMGYIDDATGSTFAEFHDYEGTLPAMTSFYHYCLKYGIPQSVYLDKHSTYKSRDKLTIQEELEGKEEPKSQFEKSLGDLGVDVIHAHSAPAKGRVERLFDTLQDRLVKELRLHNAKTKDDANRVLKHYLPKFNKRFKREARKNTDLHQPIPKTIDLKGVLAIRTQHTLSHDNTLRHEGKIYLLKDRFTSNHPKHVQVQERIDGKLVVMMQTRSLRYQEVKEAPRQVVPRPRKPRKVTAAAKDHPFRNFVLTPRSMRNSVNSGFKPINGYAHAQLSLSTYAHYQQRKREKEAKREKEMAAAT